jgi:hypothetical protein
LALSSEPESCGAASAGVVRFIFLANKYFIMNLPETVQKSLGFPKLHKVDPNTQDIPEHEKTFGNSALAQAAIPSILCGIFRHLETPEGISLILETDASNWLLTIFCERTNDLIQKIADYAGISTVAAKTEMEHIADTAITITRDSLPATVSPDQVYAFVAKHTNETLLYLPASIQLGTLLKHNNLDDQTNKMEGPVSNFLHKIERHFNSNMNK